jgi:hypothetical protein
MSTSVKYGGVWKTLNGISVRNNGIWKTVDNVFVRESGVWKTVYSNTITVFGPKTFDTMINSTGMSGVAALWSLPGSEIVATTSTNYITVSGYSTYTLSNLTINGTSVTFGGSTTLNVSAGSSVKSDAISVNLTAGQNATVQCSSGIHPGFGNPAYSLYFYNYINDSDVQWDWRFQGNFGLVIESIVGI